MILETQQIIDALKVIKHIESENCINTKHKSDAIGCYGLRPIALAEIGVTNIPEKLSVKEQDKLAFKYAKFVLKQTPVPSIDFLLYGWLKGPFAAKKLQKLHNFGKIPYRSPFEDHWYIKRYNKLLKTVIPPVYFSTNQIAYSF